MAPRARFDKDYYATLGLPPETTQDEIRKAYRRLALQWHPDRNPDNPKAAERFTEVSEAYAVLIDPAKRADYDRARRTGAPGEFAHSREDIFRDLFADPRASAIFEELAREFARMGVRVDPRYFRQTLFGGQTVVTGGIFVITPLNPMLGLLRLARAAVGAARTAASVRAREARPIPPRPPGILRGIGRIGRWLLGLPAPASTAPARGREDLVVPLRLTRAEAERGGQRRVTLNRGQRSDEILVTVPAGIRAGTRLRLRGKGHPGPGGTPGDAYLVVEITERG